MADLGPFVAAQGVSRARSRYLVDPVAPSEGMQVVHWCPGDALAFSCVVCRRSFRWSFLLGGWTAW